MADGGASKTIYAGRDFYVPSFQVRIGKVTLPQTILRDVIELRYTDTVGKFDTFEMTVNNWDDVARDFKYTGPHDGTADPAGRETLFDPGQDVEIWMGFFSPTDAAQRNPNKPDPLQLMMAGTITKVAPTFPASGQPTLKVSGTSILMKLATKQETRTYEKGLRDSQIAEKLSDFGGLKLDSKPVKVRTYGPVKDKEAINPDVVNQTNQYDIYFLLQLATKHGYDLYLGKEEKGTETELYINFGPATQNPAEYELEWGKSLVSFSPTLSTTKQVSEVTVRGWDVNEKKEIKETAKRSDLNVKGLADDERNSRIESGIKEQKEVVVDRPFDSKEQAKAFAESQLASMTTSMVTARGSTLGTPDLRAGCYITVKGIGRTFNGRYFLKSTTHTIGSGGYLTEFDAELKERKN